MSHFLFPGVKIALRGGGDLASGAIMRLWRAGFPLLIAEMAQPRLVRQTVCYGTAAVTGEITVEGITARRVTSLDEAHLVLLAGEIPLLIDPDGGHIAGWGPQAVIDCRMLKAAPEGWPGTPLLRVGLGPGFEAPLNCDAVIETNRGHYLGRVVWQGAAEPDTGTPGPVAGQTATRVLRAPVSGVLRGAARIGQAVQAGEAVAHVDAQPVAAPFDGVLRGLLLDGPVQAGEKIGDLDPRADPAYIHTISDKSLAVGGGVLEAVLAYPGLRTLLRAGSA